MNNCICIPFVGNFEYLAEEPAEELSVINVLAHKETLFDLRINFELIKNVVVILCTRLKYTV